MPGFLSEYSDTTTLKFGADGQWWVRVRQHLLRGEFRGALGRLVSPVMRSVGSGEMETKGDVDTGGYQDELVYQAVEDWNLTDVDGNPLPLAPEADKRASIDRLPEEVFDAIVGVVSKGTPGAERTKKGDEAQVAEDAAFRGRGRPRPAPEDGAAAGRGGAPDGADAVA